MPASVTLSGQNIQQTTPSSFETSTKTPSSATEVITSQITSSPSDVASLDNVTPTSDTEQEATSTGSIPSSLISLRSLRKLLAISWLVIRISKAVAFLSNDCIYTVSGEKVPLYFRL